MARRKGISKAKTSAKKSILEENDTHRIESELSCAAKDDSEDCRTSPTMELVQNSIGLLQCQKLEQQSKIIVPQLPTQKNFDENSFSDLKYLHKKFKRLASTTLNDNSTLYDSNLAVKINSPPLPPSPPKIINSIESNITTEEKFINQVNHETTTTSIETINSINLHTNHNLLASNINNTELLNGYVNDDINHQRISYSNNNNTRINSDIVDIGHNIIIADTGALLPNSTIINQKLSNQNHNSKPNINQYSNVIYVSLPTSQQTSERLANYTINQTPNDINLHGQVLSSPQQQHHSTATINIPNEIVAQSNSQYLPVNSYSSPETTQTTVSSPISRHVCPYCQLNCSKPSVLQKHIRAHTNERPFPCGPCGCAFKTKSNLYKHQRSRTHTLRTQGVEQIPDDEVSLGSDPDQDHELQSSSNPPINLENQLGSVQTMDVDRMSTSPISMQQQQYQEKPYKPKFHNVGLYNEENEEHRLQQNAVISSVIGKNNITIIRTPTKVTPHQNLLYPSPSKNVEVAQRITKLIMDNEAIVEGGKPPTQKKTLKVQSPKWSLPKREDHISRENIGSNKMISQTSVNRSVNEEMNSGFPAVPSAPIQQQQQSPIQHIIGNQLPCNSNNTNTITGFTQPLNLTKTSETAEKSRKRCSSEGFSGQDVTSHPQNPERSIIKDLLLNPKVFGAIPTSEIGETVFTCPFCNISFRNAENLKYHTICYCQGSQANSPQSAPISPAASPSHQHLRSSHSNYSEKYNPNSLAKLASTSLRQQPYTTRAPKTLATIAKSQIKLPRQKLENIVIVPISTSTTIEENNSYGIGNQTPLLSPGPLLGNFRLIHTKTSMASLNDYSANERRKEEISVFAVPSSEHAPSCTTISSNNHNFAMPMLMSDDQTNHRRSSLNNSGTLQMFGGDVQVIEKNSDSLMTYGSGGSVKSISPQSQDSEPSPIIVGAGLLSGGSAIQLPQSMNESIHKTPPTPKLLVTIAPTLTQSLLTPSMISSQITHFQFPPINSITGYNPLTLPPISSSIDCQPSTILHGGKTIPFVPGIPGPNTSTLQLNQSYKTVMSTGRSKSMTPIINNLMPDTNIYSPLPTTPTNSYSTATLGVTTHTMSTPHIIPNIKINDTDIKPKQIQNIRKNDYKDNIWSPARMAENVSPGKSKKSSAEAEIRHFNYENLISKTSIFIKVPENNAIKSQNKIESMTSPTASNNNNNNIPQSEKETTVTKKNNNFLRPTSLPLKPGTFQQKKHHGITPTQNTMPLISPETPRPSKNCIQLYLNGHAYTYLGLKCSTKMTYCTVNRAQPVYIINQHKLSMYSEWRVQGDYDPHPLGFTPSKVISLYDSRQCNLTYSIANSKNRSNSDGTVLVHSQPTIMTPFENDTSLKNYYSHHQILPVQLNHQTHRNDNTASITSPSVIATIPGGYESNEDYTYVRGRGRGRYVCSECGIRCKKPSMLKKHIRTHTDVRPYTCNICSFSFKTKGNLTKHMKSKAHYKKCIELGLNPFPMSGMDDDSNEMMDTDQFSVSGSGRTSTVPGDSDTDSFSDGDDGESESSDAEESKSRLQEHEAARCLISLSMTPPMSSMGAIPSLYSVENTSDSNHSLQNHQRRVITTYATAKSDFNMLKHEQYYSNPNLHKSTVNQEIVEVREVLDEPVPMDLTKPKPREREHQQIRSVSSNTEIRPTMSEVINPSVNPAHLLTSIVSIMDKIQRPTNESNLPTQMDESKLLQQYLTERALQDSKMKQSQMIKSLKQHNLDNETTLANHCDDIIKKNLNNYGNIKVKLDDNFDKSQSYNKFIIINQDDDKFNQTKSQTAASLNISNEKIIHSDADAIFPKSNNLNLIDDNQQQRIDSDIETTVSGIDTLAEIAANSSKLHVASVNNKIIPVIKINDNAKSVASEYLKMTSNETKRSSKISFNEDDDTPHSESDQDESNTNKILPSSSSNIARTVVVGEDGFKNPIMDHPAAQYPPRLSEDGRSVCTVCSKTFQKEYHLLLHYNIHYIERKFRCEPCGISFRTKGHLQKHERSVQHHNKVSMTSTFGVATTSNPRPFKCLDCKVAFRIHGHLAKHLRSKSHVMKLECIGKLPFGMYAEIERAGVTLTDIDTTDCDNSLASLLLLAQKLHDKDPTKFGNWQPNQNLNLLHKNSNNIINSTNSNCGINESDSDDSDTLQTDDQNQLSAEISSVRDGAFSSDSSSGSIKRKIDAITGSLDPLLIGDENNIMKTSLHVHKRLKTLSEI